MMKGLIENECGGQNPLMKLAGHFNNTSEQKLTQEAIKSLRAAAAVIAHHAAEAVRPAVVKNGQKSRRSVWPWTPSKR